MEREQHYTLGDKVGDVELNTALSVAFANAVREETYTEIGKDSAALDELISSVANVMHGLENGRWDAAGAAEVLSGSLTTAHRERVRPTPKELHHHLADAIEEALDRDGVTFGQVREAMNETLDEIMYEQMQSVGEQE